MATQLDEQAATSIFWDYENCPTPEGVSGYELASSIRDVAHRFGLIQSFKAYLEVPEYSSKKAVLLRSELQCSGVSLTDCPHNGRKDVADHMMIVDMLTWAMDHPPPGTIIIISGDRDFAYAISVLRLRRYQVVLISTPGAHISLKAQPTVCLDFSTELTSGFKRPGSSACPSFDASSNSSRSSASRKSSIVGAPATILPTGTTQDLSHHYPIDEAPQPPSVPSEDEITFQSTISSHDLHDRSSSPMSVPNDAPTSTVQFDNAPSSLIPVELVPEAVSGEVPLPTHSEEPETIVEEALLPTNSGEPEPTPEGVPVNTDEPLTVVGWRAVQTDLALPGQIREWFRLEKPTIATRALNTIFYQFYRPSRATQLAEYATLAEPGGGTNAANDVVSEPPAVSPLTEGEPVAQGATSLTHPSISMVTAVKAGNPLTVASLSEETALLVAQSATPRIPPSQHVANTPQAGEPSKLLFEEEVLPVAESATSRTLPSQPVATAVKASEPSTSTVKVQGNTVTQPRSPPLAGTPNASTSTLNKASAIRKKPIPPNFALLIQILVGHRNQGVFRPRRDTVAQAIAKKDQGLYKKVGVKGFKAYLSKALTEGIVLLGGEGLGNDSWVALHPDWHS